MAKKRAHRPAGYQTPKSTPKARPAAQPSFPATTRRARFENWSRPLLLRMQLMPTFVVPVILGVLLFLGLALPYSWAGIFLLVVGTFLTWLTAVSWPVVSPGSRALRAVVDVGILALGLAKLAGWI